MNKSNFLLKSFILFLIFGIPSLRAQDSTAIRKIKSYPQHLVNFTKNYPQEKVYLHFDNTAYYLGETIWFKAYTVRADRNALSPFSKILYVELLNTEGYVVESKKFKLENGQCHGEFKLNTTGYGGFYEVRAYTRYMLNFGAANYFSRIFTVYDNPKIPGQFAPVVTDRLNSQSIPKIRKEEPTKDRLNVDFFPEGGSLVQGVQSKVAFKATDKNGENSVVTGSVYNEKDEPVADMNSEFQGMGAFVFTPGAGKYYAKVSCNGRNYRYELPLALSKGYTVTVENSDSDNIALYIQKNAQTENEPLGLTVTCRGVLYVSQQVNMNAENAAAYKISRKLLPSGVSQFTLYNTAGDILSERVAFVNHLSQMKINVTQNKAAYNPFERVSLDFQLKNNHDQPVETTFSVAVRDESNSPYNPISTNILTDLLLSSELKGYIENPGFYFQNNDNVRRQALDLLMLTQGWTCYSWKQMVGQTPFNIKQPIEKQLYIDGNIASIVLKKKMKNVDVSMVLLGDSTSQQGKCKTDSVGNFNFGLLDFKGVAKLILQSKVKDKRKDTRIMLNRQFMPDPQPYPTAELNSNLHYKANKNSEGIAVDSLDLTTSKNQKNLSMSERDHLLKEVTVKEKQIPMKVSLKYEVTKEMDKMEDTGDWQPTDIYGFLQKTNDYVVVTPQPDGTETATYKGKAIRFVRRDSKTFATELGDDSYSSGSDNSTGASNRGLRGRLPLIDEIETISIIEDMGTISRLLNGIGDPTRVAVAVITLKKNYHTMPGGVRSTTFTGYSYNKEFFSPQYGRYRMPKDVDVRRTLYWNPDVKTDQNGHAQVTFYNNATSKSMNISAETVTENGVIGALNK
ncbi:MAG: hypothetical protein PHR83_12880 [Paludibacter sp.]|nr:hypothetical protein [Paludibacter sp.]